MPSAFDLIDSSGGGQPEVSDRDLHPHRFQARPVALLGQQIRFVSHVHFPHLVDHRQWRPARFDSRLNLSLFSSPVQSGLRRSIRRSRSVSDGTLSHLQLRLDQRIFSDLVVLRQCNGHRPFARQQPEHLRSVRQRLCRRPSSSSSSIGFLRPIFSTPIGLEHFARRSNLSSKSSLPSI